MQCAAWNGTNVSNRSAATIRYRDVLPLLQEDNLCQLVGVLEGDFTDDSKWNEEAQVWFEGRINHIGDQVIRGAASVNLSIRHWLSDLQGKSLLMSYAFSHNPAARRSLAITYGAEAGTASQSVKPSAIGELADANFLFRKTSRRPVGQWSQEPVPHAR